MMTFALLAGGLLLLVAGAEALVRGASRLARAVGVSPLVVGLVIVAYGTSTPELAVSLKGALSGQADIALGNVVGSNIFNVLFILGVSALITPLAVNQQLVRSDVPVMIGVSALAIALCMDGSVSRLDGILLLLGIIAYTYYVGRSGLRESNSEIKKEYSQEFDQPVARSWKSALPQIFWILGGLALLVWGARWFVDGAVMAARSLGISELIIGLTVVAAGTSMPEVATSIMASIRKERDIAVGNVVGSNIYNILAVLGAAAAASPNGIAVSQIAMNFDLPVMLAVAIACAPIFFTGFRIDRWEGAVFLAYYIFYVAYLALFSLKHDSLEAFSHTLLVFVVPITAMTLLIVAYRQHAARRTKKA